MKKKLKLFVSMLSFCFALSVLCFGVYAAQTVSYTIGGTVTYSAKDVYADVSGEVSGTKTTVVYTPITYSPAVAQATIDEQVATWANKALEFNNSSTPIVITITIANKSIENDLYVKITDSYSAVTSVSKTYTFDSASYTAGVYKKIAKAADAQTPSSKSFTISMSVVDPTTSISGANYGFAVDMQTTLPDSVANRLSYESGHWFLTMGKKSSSSQSEDLKWRLVAQYANSAYTAVNPASGTLASGTYVFVQETAVVKSQAWNSSGSVTNYKVSDIYNYLANTGNTGYLHDLGIDANNVVYKNIVTRTAADDTSNSDGQRDDFASQALWLLSYKEVFESGKRWLGYNGSDYSANVYNDVNGNPVSWWLRSPYGDRNVDGVVNFGSNYYNGPNFTLAVRAAFQITI